ncbi:MAG: hypothetical protein NTZ74_12745 [Chloroflexi bacterium]|nr:hypothetical protein [Chloroflexota bacterium]
MVDREREKIRRDLRDDPVSNDLSTAGTRRGGRLDLSRINPLNRFRKLFFPEKLLRCANGLPKPAIMAKFVANTWGS